MAGMPAMQEQSPAMARIAGMPAMQEQLPAMVRGHDAAGPRRRYSGSLVA
jgi:hypothetical protein